MMNLLAKGNIASDSIEEISLTPLSLKDNRLLFIHSSHLHNDIINNPDNFLKFLENSPFSKKGGNNPGQSILYCNIVILLKY